MKKTGIILILSICLGSACDNKKYGKSYVEGTVIQSDTNLPFPNVRAYLTRTKNHLKDGMAVFHEDIDSALTDQDGHYSIHFDKEKAYDYSMRVSPKGLIPYSGNYPRRELGEKNNTEDFSINPVAYLRIHLQKTSSSANRVDIAIGSPYYKTLVNHPFPFDTILPALMIEGNYQETINWAQRTPDPSASYITRTEAVYVKAGDTLIHPITFQ